MNKLQFIGEISGNHKQDLSECKRLILDAKESGCDYVKFQCYTPDSLTIDCNNKYFKVRDGTSPWYGQTYYELYKKAMTPREWFPQLFEYCDIVKIKPLCTPFSIDDLEFLESCKCPAYKIAAFEAIDDDFVKRVMSKNRKVFISVGQLDREQLKAMFAKFLDVKKIFVPFYSISRYPSTILDINPDKLRHITSIFPQVGFSDHSLDYLVTITAINLGCTIIEKHITRDFNAIDGHFSLNKDQLTQLIKFCTNYHKDLFSVHDDCKAYNRSIFAIKNIKQGERFTRENVRIIRPGAGLHPDKIDLVLSSHASDNIKIGTPLSMELLS